MTENNRKWWIKPIIFCIFIGIVAVTAEVDWVAENSEVGLIFRYTWLFSLLFLGIILPIVFMYLAGNNIRERANSDKKWFIISFILFAIANGIPPIFYIILEQTPGFFLFLQLGLFGLVPAFIFQPKSLKIRFLILIILFVAVLVPLAFLINLIIGELWLNPLMDKTIYYLLFWGIFSVFLYFFIAIGWKFGGGTRRQSWNIFVAGMLIQYSTLEDFLYFLLNGQSLPGTWPWMNNFVINLEALFGHIPTDLDLLIFCLIVSAIAIFILLDGHGYIWTKIKQKKELANFIEE
jgi:hypothetical protein